MGIRSIRTGGRAVACLLALGLVAGLVAGLLGASPAAAYDPGRTAFQGDTSSQAPMGQTDGPVFTLESVGGRIYAGGKFTSTRPPGAAAGSGETGQGYLAAFDAQTGQPVGDFAPDLGYQRCPSCPERRPVVRASVVADDGTIYFGGDFNTIGDERVNYVAAYDPDTGTWSSLGRRYDSGVGVDGPVHALALAPDGTLYVGGRFTRVGDVGRQQYVGAFRFDPGSGRMQAVPAFRPTLTQSIPKENARVQALGVSSDSQRVFVGGTFLRSNKRVVQGFVGLDAATGRNLQGAWKSTRYLRGARTQATAIEVDGDAVYVGARSDSAGTDMSRTEGVYRLDALTGRPRWYARCYGDTYAIQPFGGDVYVGSHAHDCARAGGMPEQSPRVRLAVHALNAENGVVKPYFVQTSGTTPDTRLLSRAFTTVGEPGDPYASLVMAGGFAKVNGSDRTNLVRFATGSAKPSRAAFPRASTCRRCASTKLTVRLGFDRDDIALTYEVFRGWRTDTPIRTVRRQSFFYRSDSFSFRDKGVRKGQKVFYRVRVSDPAGNQVMSVRTPTVKVGQPRWQGGR